MQSQTTYLTPGFLVTLLDKRQEVHFTQIPGPQKRGTPPRIAVVDALTRGYEGDLKELIRSVAERFDIPDLQGSHGIGHTRMATESAVTTLGAHPFPPGRINALCTMVR